MWPPESRFSLARRHGACPQRDSLLSWNSFGARNIIFMVCQGIKYDSDQSFVWLQMHECVLLGDYFHLCSGHFIININTRVHYQPKVLLPRKWQDLITPCCREAGLAATIFYFLYKAFSWALSFVCLFLRLLGFLVVVVCFWVVSVLTSVEWDVHMHSSSSLYVVHTPSPPPRLQVQSLFTTHAPSQSWKFYHGTRF